MISTQITKQVKELPPIDYREIDNMIYCAKYAHILSVALEIMLFEYLRTPKTAAQLSRDAGLNAWKLEKLCDFLVALKFLVRKNDEFSLSEPSKVFLSNDARYHAVNLVKYSIMEASHPRVVSN